jgi:hypothetical protein
VSTIRKGHTSDTSLQLRKTLRQVGCCSEYLAVIDLPNTRCLGRFREIYSVFRKLTEESFPEFDSPRFGHSNGEFELIPKPVTGCAPTLAVG